MKNIKFYRTDGPAFGYTTVGYWRWDQPNNKGCLHVYVTKMCDWRFELAVWGHEIVEILYCWLFGVTTEKADEFDNYYEAEYEAGRISPTEEPGCDPKCPYHWGHMMGIVWEHIAIHGTFASWKKYEAECNRVMGIT